MEARREVRHRPRLEWTRRIFVRTLSLCIAHRQLLPLLCMEIEFLELILILLLLLFLGLKELVVRLLPCLKGHLLLFIDLLFILEPLISLETEWLTLNLPLLRVQRWLE